MITKIMSATLVLAVLLGLLSSSEAGWRVINGTDAVMSEFPSIVSIKLQGRHFCGGTLINSNTVLTAGHCVWPIKDLNEFSLKYYQVTVTMGEYDQAARSGKEKVFQVVKTILPSTYTNSRAFVYGNDVGIMKFSGSMSNNAVSYIKYANLASSMVARSGMHCQVVGWGSIDPSGRTAARILQKATLNVLSNNECSNVFYNVRYTPSNVCAGSGRLSTSACKGDSGGPLYCNVGGKSVQVGIVSYGRVPCGQSNIPTVFTRVSNVLPWIRSHM